MGPPTTGPGKGTITKSKSARKIALSPFTIYALMGGLAVVTPLIGIFAYQQFTTGDPMVGVILTL